MRPDVVVAAADLGIAVAAEAGEDHHEEVDDAVLVGVVGVVVDLRIGDLRGVEDRLAGGAAARVDVLQRADAAERADQRRALAVEAVVLGVAGKLVPAVLDPVAGLVALGRQRRVRERGALRLRLREAVLRRAPGTGGDRFRRHRPVREQLPVGDLLEEVEGRARVGGIVDLARELGGRGRRRVLAVAVVDRDDRERPVAVAGGLEAAGRRDHLRAVRGRRLALRCAVRERRRAREVLPGDLGVLRERVGGRLDHLRLHARRAVRVLGLDGGHRPVDRGEARAVRRRQRDPRAGERRRAVVENAQRERVRLAGLDPALGGHEVVLEHRPVGCGLGRAGEGEEGGGEHSGRDERASHRSANAPSARKLRRPRFAM